MKNFFYLLALTPLLFSCSSDDDNTVQNPDLGIVPENIVNPTNTDFTNKAYGQSAIDNCVNLVSQLEKANEAIYSSKLTATQEAYLREVVANVVDRVIIPTYTNLANEVESLEAELHGLTASTITQTQINNACKSFKAARRYWELSEAFLGGAASDFDVDPTIDSWPLNRSLLHNYFTGGMTDEIMEDATVLGFHALEFILFRNGNPRNASEFLANDTYNGFTDIKGADELAYAQTVCTLLKQRTFQLQVAWEGRTAANASRADIVERAGLGTVTENGLTYSENLKQAGQSKSTFPTLAAAVSQLLADEEGSCAAIANEVGTAKIANPFSAGDLSYVESPYSHNSIADFQDNIRSIRNVWYATLNGTHDDSVKSFYNFFASTSAVTNILVMNAVNSSINAIGAMPAPFVTYCETIAKK